MFNTEILNAAVDAELMRAITLLAQGELVAVPTETVYGLAADAKNIAAVKKIFVAKNRPFNHPLIVHIASFEKLAEWAKVPAIAKIIAEYFWPGPLTMVLKKNESVGVHVTGGLDTIALRVPNNQHLLKILTMLNTGIAAPSANPHKKISPTTAQHVLAGLDGKIAAVLDAGPCTVGIESTILDLTKTTPTILRHGPITQKMLTAILKMPIDAPLIHTESIAGNMKNHYQPETEAVLMPLDQIEKMVALPEYAAKKFGIMHHSHLKGNYQNSICKKMPGDKLAYSRIMYDTLHNLDQINAQKILIEYPPNEESWQDVLDRLTKATAKK